MAQPLDPSSSSAQEILAQRAWKNRGGYLGDSIDIRAILEQCKTLASRSGFTIQELPATPKPSLLALVRPANAGSSQPTPKIYISAGIHGDEPAGPLALLQLLEENRWPNAGLWLLPCLNPTGFLLNRRENDEGTDLNRQYLQPKAEETLAHIH